MCATLTENVVLVRTRSHDLKSVKKLNCWGCALKDISIVHRMPAVEVISLSINSIESLADFAECSKLQELYLRKNEIKDINQVIYLTQLECLKKLSLEDNPCTQLDNYRFTVVKALPNLEYLDNIRVTPDEIYEAEKYGSDLFWPGSEAAQEQQEQEQMMNNNNNQNNVVTTNQTEYSQQNNSSVNNMRHPSQQSLISNPAESGYSQSSADDTMSVCSSYAIPPAANPANHNARPSTASHHGTFANNVNSTPQHYSSQQSHHNVEQQPQAHHQQTVQSHQQIHSQQQQQQQQQHLPHNSQMMPGTPKKTNMSKCTSMSDYTLYNNGNGNGHYRPMSPTQSEYNYETETVASTIASHRHSAQFDNPVNYRQGHNRTGSISNPNRFLPKGGRNRNANILSAVLCLIKELDYASLEVVDTTIHCRMEEMED